MTSKHIVGALGVAMLVAAGLLAPSAQTAYIVTLAQMGTNVVATGRGTIDLTGLGLVGREGASTKNDPGPGVYNYRARGCGAIRRLRRVHWTSEFRVRGPDPCQ